MAKVHEATPSAPASPQRWAPSKNRFRDWLYFVGPGWFVCIAYLDPGNTQADIQAGATSGYRLIWTVFWTSALSIFVQVLCTRLSVYAQMTLAEVQALNDPRWLRYMNWAIAEFSTIITDLPEVIGIGIAFKAIFGWPYWLGVCLSMLTTMMFLAVQSWGIRPLEAMICGMVSLMGVALWVEMGMVGFDTAQLLEGWVVPRADGSDLFAIVGILGAVVMPHNLYLHTASMLSRPVARTEDVVRYAVKLSSIEPVFPIFVTFWVNVAIVVIAAEKIMGRPGADTAGNTDFGSYMQSVPSGNILWGIALLAAGQSSAITTTYTGQYIMDGFLNMRLPLWLRATMTRLIAIVPCVIISVGANASAMNQMVNLVNALLAILLPFALTPLVKYTTSQQFMGKYALGKKESAIAWFFTFASYLVNAVSLSTPGGGMFGDLLWGEDATQDVKVRRNLYLVMIACQIFYLGWNVYTVLSPIKVAMLPLETERDADGCIAALLETYASQAPSSNKEAVEKEVEAN